MTHGERALAISSGFEALTGVFLLVAPSLLARLLIGSNIEGAALILAHIAGLALISLAIACWPRSQQEGGGSYPALLVYNLFVASLLLEAGASSDARGVLLWPAVSIHFILAAVITLALIVSRRRDPSPS